MCDVPCVQLDETNKKNGHHISIIFDGMNDDVFDKLLPWKQALRPQTRSEYCLTLAVAYIRNIFFLLLKVDQHEGIFD